MNEICPVSNADKNMLQSEGRTDGQADSYFPHKLFFSFFAGDGEDIIKLIGIEYSSLAETNARTAEGVEQDRTTHVRSLILHYTLCKIYPLSQKIRNGHIHVHPEYFSFLLNK